MTLFSTDDVIKEGLEMMTSLPHEDEFLHRGPTIFEFIDKIYIRIRLQISLNTIRPWICN